MNIILKILFVLLIHSFSTMDSFSQEYPTKNGKPTTIGINYYVSVNKYKFIKEFELFVNDTFLIDLEIKTDNLEGYTDYQVGDMGYHYTYGNGGDEIIIDNRENYVAYDLNELSKFKKINLSTTNNFVKTVIMHELGHSYFLQNIILCLYNSLKVSKEYDFRNQLRMYPNMEESYGAKFIEEGVCEYIINKMQIQLPSNILFPKTIGELLDKNNEHRIKYGYSSLYVKEFLDIYGLKRGIRILITNKPPNYQEIINKKIFFDRLIINEKI